MSGEQQLSGPDLTQGVSLAEIGEIGAGGPGAAGGGSGHARQPGGAPSGCLLGRAGGEPVLLVRVGDEVFAIAAHCTHYGGPLAEGLLVGDTVRCPWHHACFSLRSGEPLRAPALNPLARYRVERQGDRVTVHEKLPPATPPVAAGVARGPGPDTVVTRRAAAAAH